MIYFALFIIALLIVPWVFVTARRWYLLLMQRRCIEKYLR